MSGNKITLYVDIVSPFGYMAYWLLRNSPVCQDISLTIVPIVLGGLHKLCNNTAPIFIKNKSEWINRDRALAASRFNIPVRANPPRTFPVSTVNALRVLVALQADLGDDDQGTETVARVLDAFWAMLWNPDAEVLRAVQGLRDEGGKGEFDVKDVKALEEVMAGVDGVGAEMAKRVVGKIGEKGVKDRLMKNTEKAFEAGAFGLPWFDCTNAKGETEGFWGFDHLDVVCEFLGVEGDLRKEGRAARAML